MTNKDAEDDEKKKSFENLVAVSQNDKMWD